MGGITICANASETIIGWETSEYTDAGLIYGRDLDLTAVEFKLLQLLAAHPGRIYRRGQLMDRIYPDERSVSDRTIDSHVKKLRRKIEAAGPGEEWIHSVYGAGYKYEEPS